MKKLNLLMLAFVCQTTIAENVKTVKFNVEKVTVFTQGTQLYANSTVQLVQGDNTIVFDGVSPNLDQQSIQASGKGNFAITDIQYSVKQNDKPIVKKNNIKFDKEINELNDSISDINFVLEELQNKKDVLNTEKSLLLNNRIIKGETRKDSLNLLKESMEYLQVKMNAINTELLKIKRAEKKSNEQKQELTKRMNDLYTLKNEIGEPNDNQANKTTYQIKVSILADAAGSAAITLNYFVNQAGWTSSYDLRGESRNDNINIIQKAAVYQSTGLDWSNVKIKLSTATPNQNNTLPKLTASYIDYYTSNYGIRRTDVYNGNTFQGAAALNFERVDKDIAEELLEDGNQSKNASFYTEVKENRANVTYDIKVPYTIASDNKPHNINIINKELATKYTYTAIPKLDHDVFLMANITDWENLNLIDGQAKIYFDGAYVGETYLNPEGLEDTLSINLGRDQTWVVNRKQLKEKNKEKILDNDKIKRVTYEITVRNTKDFNASLKIEDQIPVSKQKDIAVKLIDSNGASYNENTGKLTWKANLKPKETKVLTFTYEVKYPSEKLLSSY